MPARKISVRFPFPSVFAVGRSRMLLRIQFRETPNHRIAMSAHDMNVPAVRRHFGAATRITKLSGATLGRG